MTIILDANILIKDYHLEGTAFKMFFPGCYKAGWKAKVPAVVVEEVVASYARQFLKHRRSIDKAINSLKRLACSEPPKCDTHARMDC